MSEYQWPVLIPRRGGRRGAEGMCIWEVLLLQGLHQHGPELGVNAPQRAFPIGLEGTERGGVRNARMISVWWCEETAQVK